MVPAATKDGHGEVSRCAWRSAGSGRSARWWPRRSTRHRGAERSPRCRRATRRGPRRRWPVSPRPVPVVPLARLWEDADIVVECAPAGTIARDRRAGARPRPHRHGVELRRVARQFRPGRAGAPARRPHPGAERRAARRSTRCRRRRPRARYPGSTWSPASRRAASRARPISSSTASRRRASRRRNCVFSGNAREAARGFPANVNVAAALGLGRDRAGPHDDRDLGRPRRRPQHPPDRGRRPTPRRLSMQIENVPSARKPEDRPADPAIGDRGAQKADQPARDRDLTPGSHRHQMVQPLGLTRASR